MKEEELTKKIYEVMQIPYLSERHDAIKALLSDHRNQIKKELKKKWPKEASETAILGKEYRGYSRGYNQGISEAWQVVEECLYDK